MCVSVVVRQLQLGTVFLSLYLVRPRLELSACFCVGELSSYTKVVTESDHTGSADSHSDPRRWDPGSESAQGNVLPGYESS